MGTRHLTCVVKDSEFKVAQYGQWDGYPSSAGIDILNFLRTQDMNIFRKQIDKCRFASAEEVKSYYRGFINAGGGMTFEQSKAFNKSKYGYLSRDTGADILKIIQAWEDDTIPLNDSIDFAADGLFCEWAYVIDLDQGGFFETYTGFLTTPVPEDQRFTYMNQYERTNEYYPVQLAARFSFSQLPTNAEFLDIVDID